MEVCRWRYRHQKFVVWLLWLGIFAVIEKGFSATAFLPSSCTRSTLGRLPNLQEKTAAILSRKSRRSPLLFSEYSTTTKAAESGKTDTTTSRRNEAPHHVTRQATFDLTKRIPTPTSRWRRIFRRKKSGSEVHRLAFSYDINILDMSAAGSATVNNNTNPDEKAPTEISAETSGHVSMIHPLFEDLYDRLVHSFDGIFWSGTNSTMANVFTKKNQESSRKTTTGVILIHPIGVGIGKWFYNRLLESLYNLEGTNTTSNTANHRLLVVAPDLLGSGTACNPIDSGPNEELNQLPLLTVQDWAAQTNRLMANLEKEYPNIENWCLVANGGCSPIALEVAEQSIRTQNSSAAADADSSFQSHVFQRPVTNVILSSVPRLPFFLPLNCNQQARRGKERKVEKSYKTLCGPVGRLFWWYALRKQGKFIQSFSERNLVAEAANLGDDWTPNCVATARMYNGKSRYSTFSFLAGSLQMEGCRDSLEALRGSGVTVDIIQGRDRRRNRAKSVFWQTVRKTTTTTTKKKKKRQPEEMTPSPPAEDTLQQVLKRNGNRGEVLEVGGRISLAHEDAPGYAKALVNLLDLD